jgi:octaprenyl-diphosphate synthase
MFVQEMKKIPTENMPLDELAQLCEESMAQTNAIIIEQMKSEVKLIPQLAGYLVASGGKRIRPLLTLATTMIFDGEMSRAQSLAACVEFIHTATLLHDDVVDKSKKRRGKASANTVFGNQAWSVMAILRS